MDAPRQEHGGKSVADVVEPGGAWQAGLAGQALEGLRPGVRMEGTAVSAFAHEVEVLPTRTDERRALKQ